MALFTRYQINQLAQYLIEDHGSCLNDSQLSEQIGLLLEDLAGTESATETVIQTTTDQLRSAYHDLTGQDR